MGDIYDDILNDKDLTDPQKLEFLQQLPPRPKTSKPAQTSGTRVSQMKAANPEAGSGVSTMKEGGGFVQGEKTSTSMLKDVARYAVPAAVVGGAEALASPLGPPGIYAAGAVGGLASEALLQELGINRKDPTQLAVSGILPATGRMGMTAGAFALNKGMHLIPGFNQAARGALTPEARLLGEKLFQTPVASEALYSALKQQSGGKARLTQFPSLQQATKEMRTDIENISWEQLQADLKQNGLENLFDDIEQSIAGAPAKMAKTPPRTVSGTLGEGTPQQYASTMYGTVPLDSAKQAAQVSKEFPSLNIFEKPGARPIVGDRKTLPIKGTGLPSQLEEIAPAKQPGMTFVQAKANIEGMGKMIANASDDKKRGVYKRLYGSMLDDLETMEVPPGTPVELWKEARQAYKTEKTRTMFQDIIEKNTTNVESVPLINPDGILKALRTNKAFTDRLSKPELDTLTANFSEMAKLTGKNPQRLMGVLAGMAVSHSAGGALTGYVASDLLSKALMSEGGRTAVMNILKKNGPSEYFRRAGSIIGAALSGLGEKQSEDIENPFMAGHQVGTLPTETRTDPKAVERSPAPPAPILTPEDIKAKITKTAKAKGLPPDLALAVSKVESGFDQSKVGTKDDVGLFQMTPVGAKDVGLSLADRYDPDKNIEGGTSLLGKMMTRYKGDKAKALAAYNAGPTAVDSGRIPASTQAYVVKVMQAQQEMKDAQKRR